MILLIKEVQMVLLVGIELNIGDIYTIRVKIMITMSLNKMWKLEIWMEKL